MARLYQQIICKTKSLNDRLFSRISIRSRSILSVTTLKSKLSTSKRALSSLALPLSSVQMPSIRLPPINISVPRPSLNHNLFQKHQHKQRKRTKYRNRYKFGFASLATYLFTEILFNLRCRFLENYADKIPVDVARPHISHERCEDLLDLALKYAELSEGGFSNWLKLWFNECDINDLCEGNILELFHWGFFVSNYVKYDGDDINDPELQFREEFVRNALQKLETKMNHKFPAGYNEKIRDRFNTKAAMNIDYHPLALYLLIKASQIWSNIYFTYFFGLKSEWINGMKVWYKMSSNRECNKATLFLHGVGIGLGPYYNVVHELMNKEDDDMFCMIEIPHITIDILHLLPWPFSNYSYLTHKLPANISDYIDVFDAMCGKLSAVNDVNWTFVGHSYGTMIASNMYLRMENEEKPRLILLDPACFCLSHPSTVAAFVTDIDDIVANDEFMPKWNARKILAKELMIACYLRKYFHWFDLVIYPEEMVSDKQLQLQHIVVTASKDNVVPIHLIQRGIHRVNSDADDDQNIIIHQSVDKGHGEWIWDKECIKNMLRHM